MHGHIRSVQSGEVLIEQGDTWVPFFVVSLMKNCNEFLDSTIRTSFEMPSVIVPLRCIVRLAAKLVSLIRLPYLSIKDGFGSNNK